MIRPNERLILTYPKSTIVENDHGFEQRHLIVRSVRDLVTDPLTIREFQRRPMNRRSRWIVTAVDLRQNAFRQFYLGNSIEYQTESDLKIGLYVPGRDQPRHIIGPPFEPTRRGRIRLARMIRELSEKPLGSFRIGIFADDMRIQNVKRRAVS